MKIVKMIVPLMICLVLSGCVSYRLEGPTRLSNESEIAVRKLLATADVEIIDDRGFWLKSYLREESFLNPQWKIKKDNDRYLAIKIHMHKCDVVKGFWRTPYNLFMVPLLSGGKVYDCKISVDIFDKRSGETKSLESKATDFTYTGLAGLLGGFMGSEISAMNRKDKAMVFAALREYLLVESE